MRFEAKIKVKARRDTGWFSTKQAAIDWARDRQASQLTITEMIEGDVRRVVYSGSPK